MKKSQKLENHKMKLCLRKYIFGHILTFLVIGNNINVGGWVVNLNPGRNRGNAPSTPNGSHFMGFNIRYGIVGPPICGVIL